MNESMLAEMEAWQATRWMRLLDWIEAHTTGKGSWPWGMIWLKRGFAFHFASGSTGFALTFPLPRWFPGFVKPYQVQSLRTRAGRRESDLQVDDPALPARTAARLPDAPTAEATVTCPKCGGDEILTRYHARGCSNEKCSCASCTYDSHAKRHDEHLHRICQTCQYDWTDDVAAGPENSHSGAE